jgi:hypothetical protein
MMNRTRNARWAKKSIRTALLLTMALTAALNVSACGKKKPPAPPPVVPKPVTPPPPPPVSFDTISQEMKADARVQFAPELKLEDEEVARSIISLSDALARGDAATITGMVSRPARPVIETIESMGGFSSDVEAVRVVFITKNDDQNGFKTTLDDVNRMFSGEKEAVEEADRKITAEVARQIGALMGAALAAEGGFDASQFAPPLTAEKLLKFKEQWEKLRADPSKAAIVEQIGALLSGTSMVPGLKDAEYLALIAVQTPRGVELTGWGLEKAFGKWTFHPASTDGSLKASASEWDNVGLAGFSADSTKGLDIKAKTSAEGAEGTDPANPDAPKTDAPAETDPNNPDKQQAPPGEKRTPGGPVKIPGSGGR